LKWRKGKIAVQPRRIVNQALRNGLRCLAIQQEALLVSCELRQSHGDPFDRLLYSQAKHSGFRLVSIDRKLADLDAMIMSPK
jgi:PIN domain nuclease of toxin-antitoxin system